MHHSQPGFLTSSSPGECVYRTVLVLPSCIVRIIYPIYPYLKNLPLYYFLTNYRRRYGIVSLRKHVRQTFAIDEVKALRILRTEKIKGSPAFIYCSYSHLSFVSYGSRILWSLAGMYLASMYESNHEHSFTGYKEWIYLTENFSESDTVTGHSIMTQIQIAHGFGVPLSQQGVLRTGTTRWIFTATFRGTLREASLELLTVYQ